MQAFNLFAYCSNNPVMYVDNEGNSAAAAVMGFSWLTAIDGFLPIFDIIFGVGLVAAIAYDAINSDTESKAESETITHPELRENTYYHVTSMENVAAIISSGMLMGNPFEGGFVFAWGIKPNKFAAKHSGAHQGVIISFKTYAAFELDVYLGAPQFKCFVPLRSVFPGSVHIWDVQIVEVYN